MKTEIREVNIWLRSAERHERNNEPVAALFARNLAYQAQQARDEYEEIHQLADAQHREAVQKENT